MNTKKPLIAYVPNTISALRIVCTLALLLVPPLKTAFMIMYSVAGVTDVADGFIARRYHVESALGSILDSVADLLFYATMLVCLVPILLPKISVYVWVIVAAAAVIRIASYGFAAYKFHRFASVHTYMNKATGFAVFCIPYFVSFMEPNAYCAIPATLAALGSLEELLLHITNKEYTDKRKTIFMK